MNVYEPYYLYKCIIKAELVNDLFINKSNMLFDQISEGV